MIVLQAGPHTAGRFCRSDHPCPLHSACYGVRKLCQFKRNNKKACLATWNVRKCSRVVPQAGNDDQQWGMNEDEMTKTALRTLENTLVDICDYVDALPPPDASDVGSGFLKLITDRTEDLRGALRITVQKIQRSRAKLEAGETVDLSTLAEELLEDYAPTPLIGALTRIPGYAISIFAIGWFWGLLDVNGWEKFHWSASSGLVWGAFTIPYFLFTFLFWNGFVFNDVKPVRAFKAVEASYVEQEVTKKFLKEATIPPLVIEGIMVSILQVFLDQGCYYSAMVSLSTGPSPMDALGMGFGTQAVQVVWPKAIRSVIAVGSLGLLLAFGGVLRDGSLWSMEANGNYFGPNGILRSRLTQDEVNLLVNPDVQEGRRVLTAALAGLQATYLAAEMLATGTLLAPMVTHALGSFVCYKAIQDTRTNPKETGF